MERRLTRVGAAAARAELARAWLAGEAEAPERAGSIDLREHQREGIARLRAVIAEFGGAMLADAVGLGKTYVAAALIRESRDPLLVCPAALRDMWRGALAAVGTSARIYSYSELSRGRVPEPPTDLLVLDEAHHARTPSARRYASLARLAAGARVLAISATPIHNSRDDLSAVLALFLGARAWTMSDAELARCVVRREHLDVPGARLPALAPLEWLAIPDDGELLRAIVELPSPVPPAGGGDGGALIALGLVRQWASSRAALEGALRRRLARAAGLGAALEAGFHPTAADLRAWTAADDSVQLAFPSLVAAAHADPAPLLAALRAHEHGLRGLLARSRASTAADAARAERLRALRRAHAGARIVAFSQYADTVHGLFRLLARDEGVAALTARGARVAGGKLTRREALARFAPRAMGVRAPAAAESIQLLLTTDLVSEGLDLRDASVVVHLDLPWTPARMEQRVGRSCRLDAPHACTAAYAFAPPAAAETLLAIERRLRTKLAAAGRLAGIAGAILPGFGLAEPPAAGATALREHVRRVIASWRTPDPAAPIQSGVVAFVQAPRRALLALLELAGRPVLAAAIDEGELSTEFATIAEASSLVDGSEDAAIDDAVLERALIRVREFARRQHAGAAVEGAALFRAASRRAALRRLATITRRAPLHARATLAPLAAAARRVITAPFGVGAEHVLGEIAAAPLADEAWLRALAQFGAIHAASGAPSHGVPRLLALIVAVAR